MKKGFTIAEMLGTVIILCIIAIIAFPPILNLVKGTEKEIDEKTKELVITAASEYVTTHNNDYSKIQNAVYCVTVKELMRDNLISNNTINSSKLSENNGVIINVTDNYTYEYEFTENCENRSYAIGQLVKLNIGSDTTSTWYVIENSNSNSSSVKLLKAKNIDSNFYAFDEINRRTTEKNSYCTSLANGCNAYSKVDGIYTNGSLSGTVTEDSSIKIKVDEYGDSLNLGDDLKEIRLITKEELESLGCSISDNICTISKYDWVYSERYWTMSPYETVDDVWFVYYDVWFDYESPSNEHGIRPVIVVSKDIIN